MLDHKQLPNYNLLLSIPTVEHFQLIRALSSENYVNIYEWIEGCFFGIFTKLNHKHLITIENYETVQLIPSYIYFFFSVNIASQRFLNFMKIFKKYIFGNSVEFFGIKSNDSSSKNCILLKFLLNLCQIFIFKIPKQQSILAILNDSVEKADSKKSETFINLVLKRRAEIYHLMSSMKMDMSSVFNPLNSTADYMEVDPSIFAVLMNQLLFLI